MTEHPPNRLIHEKSPYLLQHAHNPVDWYPWGEEAFQRARAEDKPIFLSIGYSTCHWCHVMERESFENPDIARLMNEHYVNIKVDREERPDVDQIYMAFVQATTGGGGWPMSVFLTPELKPFFGGTYFPPEDRYGRRGFASLLGHIANVWRERRDDLRRSGDSVIAALTKSVGQAEASELLDRGVLTEGFRVFRAGFDTGSPGFGEAPKFPRPVVLNFLLRYFDRTGDPEAAEMVLANLVAMARGGIHDHLGGGFHRYSVDRYWHVPHFEKMLYDQAQLVGSLVEMYQLCGAPELATIARSTIEYVLRDLRDAGTGGFYSAEDADSPVAPGSRERAEGAFYVFTQEEIEQELGQPLAALFCHHYGIEPDGNAEDPHGELRGKNVLHQVHTLGETAEHFSRDRTEVEAMLAEGRARLLAYRNRRPRPHLDDKILTAWNGLMISALARAATVLGEPRYLEAATQAARFFAERMWRPEGEGPGTGKGGVLMRRYRDGEVAIPGFLDDYAMLVQGLIDLYEASFDLDWLELAERITDRQVALFGDPEGGAFFATSGTDASVLVRMRDDYDGAEPSGNSVAALNLARLGYLLDRQDLLKLAHGTVRFYSSRLRQQVQALPQMVVAFDFLYDSPVEVVVAGEPEEAGTAALLAGVQRHFVPRGLVIRADAKTRERLGRRLGVLAGMAPVDGHPAAYVCRDWHCERPTSDAVELERVVGMHRFEVPNLQHWL
ncbi:MAG TPA: thioredoxin domain-containing protein [Polyangia bacterium]|nr:thioredoxin domain-containing protein [Polyangia bacterium]